MLRSIPSRGICLTCRGQLLAFFTNGFCARSLPLRFVVRRSTAPQSRKIHLQKRAFHASIIGRKELETEKKGFQDQELRQKFTGEEQEGIVKDEIPEEELEDVVEDESLEVEEPMSEFEMEQFVRTVKQTYGDILPKDILTAEEYSVYERLYGPPLGDTLPTFLEELEEAEEEDVESEHQLFKENDEGELEEVRLYDGSETEEGKEGEVEVEDKLERPSHRLKAEARAQLRLEQDIADAASNEDTEKYTRATGAEDLDDSHEDRSSHRTHPLTAAGRFDTSPSTLQLPKDGFVDPVTVFLSRSSNRQLAEAAQKTFGGPGLPNSTATPSSKHHLQQQPIALEASQSKMQEMEADSFLAAVMPGAFATIRSTLVEVRKRLGPEWLSSLLRKEGGPRIMDAGAGGAGVLAWREMLQTEWEMMHPDGVPREIPIPVGKATVVTGSPELRNRASALLEDTTFLPRLPDYFAPRDLPIPEEGQPPTRKQYDIVIAPHTLWSLKEDYMRKAQVQNLWSLLNPKGGVLILIEKGLPRGFELIAGAREVLLKNQIASPESLSIENVLQDPSADRYSKKEEGMIIAPCTNHAQCPMYSSAQTKGRKDYCHFSQRFIRPPYLQRILGASSRNHEDIRFSYIALRRGIDKRLIDNILQGDVATDAAFIGHEGSTILPQTGIDEESEAPTFSDEPSQQIMLALPRQILPPLKRRGHVILDLCTPSGQIERWTVPKSFSRQAYRDARKSRWGDLWALGAKTRIARNVKVGKTKGQNAKEAKRVLRETGFDEADKDKRDERLSGREKRGQVKSRGEKGVGRKGKKKAKVLEDEVFDNGVEEEEEDLEEIAEDFTKMPR
ncbi:MAG: 37S ribosomal protein S22 [Icmadophila ericetorum]|nr:37S ribosomal protein S22 [Icmadophila ericetorum]